MKWAGQPLGAAIVVALSGMSLPALPAFSTLSAQQPARPSLRAGTLLPGLKLDGRGNVETDASYMTSVPGVFAAGDMRRGQSLVVWAIAEGRSAARGIDAFLMGRSDL